MINEIQKKATAITKVTRLNKLRVNICCEKPDHRYFDCKTAKIVTECRKVFSNKNFVLTVQELNTELRNDAALKRS